MKKRSLVMLIALCAVIGSPPFGLSQQVDYPWVHYFDRQIGCVYADAEWNVLVSTGDWNYTTGDGTGAITYWYLSDGVFKIWEGEIDKIEFPAGTLVLGFATDSGGTTWALFGEGQNHTQHAEDLPWKCQATVLDSVSRSPLIANPRLARIQGTGIVVDSELTASIPGKPVAIVSDVWGTVFVISYQVSYRDVDSGGARYFVSWWPGAEPGSLRIQEVPHVFDYVITSRRPSFGPDGLMYLLASNTEGIYYARSPSGVLALDPQDEEWCVYYGGDRAIYCVYVDQFNVKWFGTQDGLFRLDAGNWASWTTANSGLPYNGVRQITYDEIDNVYYVVSQYCDSAVGDCYGAFAVLSGDGQRVGPPLNLPDCTDLWIPKAHRSGATWYLMPYVIYDVIYSYDHRNVRAWHLRDWVSVGADTFDLSIGPVGDRRTFLALHLCSCVMIW
ncbi:MAG TPA: hypothetical protein VM163_03910 [bacterium]|nr:hypothetical protein [bacterium]